MGSASWLTQDCLGLMTDQVANEKGQYAPPSRAGTDPQDCGGRALSAALSTAQPRARSCESQTPGAPSTERLLSSL